MYRINLGDIGEGEREYEFQPLTAPSVPEPVIAPAPEREPVGVPA